MRVGHERLRMKQDTGVSPGAHSASEGLTQARRDLIPLTSRLEAFVEDVYNFDLMKLEEILRLVYAQG